MAKIEVTDADREYYDGASDEEIAGILLDDLREARRTWWAALKSLFQPEKWQEGDYFYSSYWCRLWFKALVAMLLGRGYRNCDKDPHIAYKYETVTVFNARSDGYSRRWHMLEVHPKLWRYHINTDWTDEY